MGVSAHCAQRVAENALTKECSTEWLCTVGERTAKAIRGEPN